MKTYKRVTTEIVERGNRTEWRIVGWSSDEKPLTIAYCPNEEMAEQLKEVLTEAGKDRQPSPSKKEKT
ncbi:MAG TPA: hypothetical protein VGJ57_06425 [Nitrospirales bacterium]|jgi:hypothetical protein